MKIKKSEKNFQVENNNIICFAALCPFESSNHQIKAAAAIIIIIIKDK